MPRAWHQTVGALPPSPPLMNMLHHIQISEKIGHADSLRCSEIRSREVLVVRTTRVVSRVSIWPATKGRRKIDAKTHATRQRATGATADGRVMDITTKLNVISQCGKTVTGPILWLCG